MATRMYFRPLTHENCFFTEEFCDFKYYSGFAVSQKQKSIRAFHEQISKKHPGKKILEVSSKSIQPIGVHLSAFNLKLYNTDLDKEIFIENIFQSSKVFTEGGPYTDLLNALPVEAKRDSRLTNSGMLVKFYYNGIEWPLRPLTAFYDWIYINAARHRTDLIEELVQYDVFTDIEFNHQKSINCQARSAAFLASLYIRGELDQAISSIESFVSYYRK